MPTILGRGVAQIGSTALWEDPAGCCSHCHGYWGWSLGLASDQSLSDSLHTPLPAPASKWKWDLQMYMSSQLWTWLHCWFVYFTCPLNLKSLSFSYVCKQETCILAGPGSLGNNPELLLACCRCRPLSPSQGPWWPWWQWVCVLFHTESAGRTTAGSHCTASQLLLPPYKSRFIPSSLSLCQISWMKKCLPAPGFSRRQNGEWNSLKMQRGQKVFIFCYSMLPFLYKLVWLLGPQAGRLHTVNGIGLKKELEIL